MASSTPAHTLTDEQDKWSAYGKTRATVDEQPLSKDELDKLTRWFHASLYLCLGMLYLKDNPLLQEPLKKEHIKPRLLGHWGSDAVSKSMGGTLLELETVANPLPVWS